MKKHIAKLLILSLSLIAISKTNAQTNNWSRLDSVKNQVRIYGGIDYSFTYGLQYGKIIKTKNIIWMPNIDFSMPFGGNLTDDFKLKLGSNAMFFQSRKWKASADFSIINRQFKNPFVRMHGLGLEAGIHFGYYKPKWFINMNLSTDNSLLTHIKHSDAYLGNYSGAIYGWYQNTASNQLLGFNFGYSLKKMDFTLSSGLIWTDRFKSKPSVPFNAKLGINYRF